MTDERRSEAVEDTFERPPEWEDIELGYGQPPTLRSYGFDPVHGYFRSSGPRIQVHLPDRPF